MADYRFDSMWVLEAMAGRHHQAMDDRGRSGGTAGVLDARLLADF